jgi:hypothetical protein
VEGHEAKEASTGCEPGVARTDAAATFAFDMVQEREDGIGIDHGNGKGRRRDPGRTLSTYLGHTHLNYTYWYLHQNPSLMKQAITRLEHYWEASA